MTLVRYAGWLTQPQRERAIREDAHRPRRTRGDGELGGRGAELCGQTAARLHHSCTTREGRDGLVTVMNGQEEKDFEQGVHLFSQVGGPVCTELIMLRSVVRFHLAPQKPWSEAIFRVVNLAVSAALGRWGRKVDSRL